MIRSLEWISILQFRLQACHGYANSAVTWYVAWKFLQILHALLNRPLRIRTMNPVSIRKLAKYVGSSVSTLVMVSNSITRCVRCGQEN